MAVKEFYNLGQFLKDYPGMSIRPYRGDGFVIRGTFNFCGTPPNGIQICDSYELEIMVPTLFPKAIPTVKELSRKIPRDGKHHVYNDETLCLGSPLHLMKKIAERPTLTDFVETCLVPYLYAVTNKLQNGGDFVFSELAHGVDGIINDYMDMFGLKSKASVLKAIELLGFKRRVANKLSCPCNCGKRLGSCVFHKKLNGFRNIASRSWFRMHSNIISVMK
ncbi:MAG: hypothetical protein PHO83_00885 [Geobacteraceae bacterium]|nr:hypothetical protein [Geobacteraceae bacterium]